MLKNVILQQCRSKIITKYTEHLIQQNPCRNITKSICGNKIFDNQNRQFSNLRCVKYPQKQLLGTKSTLLSTANLSGYFVKLKNRPKTETVTRFNRDNHYEKVKSQDFGPVTSGMTASDRQGMTSWEHAKRDHLVYDGVKYGELPIAFISAKYNNTVIHITDHTGTQRYSICSCGMAGFKNARKKTQHAAEQTAKLAAEKAIISSNVKTVRVKLKGAGYGRLGAIRGLVMGGMNIASVTDMTGLQFEGLSERPRAIRRI